MNAFSSYTKKDDKWQNRIKMFDFLDATAQLTGRIYDFIMNRESGLVSTLVCITKHIRDKFIVLGSIYENAQYMSTHTLSVLFSPNIPMIDDRREKKYSSRSGVITGRSAISIPFGNIDGWLISWTIKCETKLLIHWVWEFPPTLFN